MPKAILNAGKKSTRHDWCVYILYIYCDFPIWVLHLQVHVHWANSIYPEYIYIYTRIQYKGVYIYRDTYIHTYLYIYLCIHRHMTYAYTHVIQVYVRGFCCQYTSWLVIVI